MYCLRSFSCGLDHLPMCLDQHNSITGADPVGACFQECVCVFRCADSAACFNLRAIPYGFSHKCHISSSCSSGTEACGGLDKCSACLYGEFTSFYLCLLYTSDAADD